MTQRLTPEREAEIRVRWGRVHGPWRLGHVERFHVFTPDGATMAHERVLLRMNEHFAYETDADAIANAPSDVDVLLCEIDDLRAELAGAEERGAARERAAVAAWLEADWLDRTSSEIADCVARGDHVRTSTTPPDAGEPTPS